MSDPLLSVQLQRAWLCLSCRDFVIDEVQLLAPPSGAYSQGPEARAFCRAHAPHIGHEVYLREVKFLPDTYEPALTALCASVQRLLTEATSSWQDATPRD